MFDEPNDDWLKCIEATIDELLGTYSKAEDNALSAAFEGRGKKRLNRVFDAIGFVYPDYHYPLRGKKRKVVASAITTVLKGKKVKVLTHRPCYIEPVVVPEFGEGTSSATEAKQAAPIAQSAEEPIVEPNVQKAPAATPKRRRMASMLDTVLETTKALSPAPTKKIVEATKVQAEAKAGPSAPIETKAVVLEDEVDQQTSDTGVATEQEMAEKAKSPIPEALVEDIDYIVRHASGKKLSKEETLKAKHYAQKLKYLKGALVFNGTNEDDFLYCLPNNKEISVCREIANSMGFPKLEEGLSVMSKDDLADSLAYNSIKV
jgi:chemotaxis protein histidine kinase CheA